MAKREVIQLTCDRCGRTETQGKDDVNSSDKLPEFSGTLWMTAQKKEIKVSYQDLCRSCRRAVTNYFNRLTKIEEGEEEPVAV